MNGSLHSNVFYLPAHPVTPAAPAPMSLWSAGRARIVAAWERARRTVIAVIAVIRDGGRTDVEADYRSWLAAAETTPPERPPLSRPARIIDFELARLRLRP
jgi:hypothetical protein